MDFKKQKSDILLCLKCCNLKVIRIFMEKNVTFFKKSIKLDVDKIYNCAMIKLEFDLVVLINKVRFLWI